jgi:hypothetical protein
MSDRAMSGRLTGAMDGWFTYARRRVCASLCEQSIAGCPLTRRVTSATGGVEAGERGADH